MECDGDAREEIDDTAAPVRSNSMQKLIIRTLPKGCNPMPAVDRPPSRGGPIVPTHDNDNPFDDLTDAKLRLLSGKQDLSRVTYLQLTVDTHKQSVEALGVLLPSLTQLRLHESVLHSFRDLGTSLHSLQVLWLMRSGVKDLDGIGALTGLRELYLQFNEISDVSPLSMHDALHVVGMCVQLASLNLTDNPVANIPQYRLIVCSYMPQLQTLDSTSVTASDRIEVTPAMIDQALSYVHPAAAVLQRCDSVKPKTLFDSPSTTSIEQLSAAAATPRVKDHHSSELTHGTDVVFAGNVTSALRRRSHEHFHVDVDDVAASNNIRPATPASSFPPRPSTPLHRESITDTLDRASELDLTCRLSSKSRDSILHELKAWKLESTVGGTADTLHVGGATFKADIPSTTSTRLSVKEAFVEVSPTLPPPSRKDPRQRSTGKQQQHQVDILVLDDMPEEVSPTQRQWNLDLACLSPRIGIVPKRPSRQYMMPHDAEDDDSSSDSDDRWGDLRPSNILSDSRTIQPTQEAQDGTV
ncbi:hypothetical protein H310_03794 [Aphanomyces invadans]|uniref:Leucine-rich repeat-containing protein 56 n=1 Tax=Aphanomyces invadans TaxID=157072 RepID=A0A024UDU0_9STRA|nr:hypothetical protein H310_03794 [Aphanomyces invadans]ETW04581.1 hypothetical protein H310_03794 [Aphanomyces invadans]|eukprot:XP_008866019.1 hypothetical protein H310_03794 [Aphanomyces invadans]